MTNILGTILDSSGAPLSGKLQVTLSGNLTDTTTTPNNVYVTQPYQFTITSGVININLAQTQSSSITYLFEFYLLDTSSNLITPALLSFYAIVPAIATVQFANLVPTGMVNAALDTGALRVAELIASNPLLSSNIGGPFPQGDFSLTTSYKYRDMVNYLNRAYICSSITNISGILPTNTSYWQNIPVEPDGSLILGDVTPYGVAWLGSGKSASQNEVYGQVQNLLSLDSQKAPVTTPTFSGVCSFNNTLKVNPVSTFISGVYNPGLDIQSAISSRATIRLSNNVGTARWEIYKTEDAEGGSNTGSLLNINAFADDGSLLGSALYIQRNNRTVGLSGNVTSSSPSTGTLLIGGTGGLGVGGNINAGGNLTVTGNATVATNLTVTGSLSSGVYLYNRNIDVCNNGDFTVGGSSTTFYPVLFRAVGNSPSQGYSGTAKLQIYRSSLNSNSANLGSFHLRFTFQPYNYGNTTSIINNIEYIPGYGTYADAVGDIQDCTATSGVNEVAVWLRGGMTYAFRCPDAGVSWLCYNQNSGGTSIVNSSGATLAPTTTQSLLIISNKFVPWTDVTVFQNSYQTYTATSGYNFLKYKKSSGIAFIRGAVQLGIAYTSGQVMFNLPPTMYPAYNNCFVQYVYTGTAQICSARIDIQTNGNVVLNTLIGYSSGTTGFSYLNLDICYPTI